MQDFLKFFDEKAHDFPMHLAITYSKICDWCINIYKKVAQKIILIPKKTERTHLSYLCRTEIWNFVLPKHTLR